MEWNWQLVDRKNLPEFDTPVILGRGEKPKEDGTKMFSVAIGTLTSIDGEGFNWAIQGENNIFGGFGFPAPVDKNGFQPTHWCKIQTPKD